MPLRESSIRARAKGNDIRRRLLLPPGFRIFFLKRGGETSRFVVIREIPAKDGGATIKYSDWRQQLVLNVCTLDDTFQDDAAQTSYWAAGVGYGMDDKTFDVYAVDPQRRDVVAPTANNAAWKFFLTREPKESFILADVAAKGSYQFDHNPLDGDLFPALNGYTGLVFKSVSTTWNEILIGATVDDTIANMISQLAEEGVFLEVTFTQAPGSLILTFGTLGSIGNEFTLGDATDNITPSAPTLTGGASY